MPLPQIDLTAVNAVAREWLPYGTALESARSELTFATTSLAKAQARYDAAAEAHTAAQSAADTAGQTLYAALQAAIQEE